MCAQLPVHSDQSFRLSTPFVGRELELRQLRATLDRARDGQGQVVLMAGEPGIGKTRTAQEFATVATSHGARVLWGRCIEWEGAPAYWPWMQMVRAYVHDHESQSLCDELGTGAPDIAQIVPEVRERIPDLPAVSTIDPEQAVFRLFDSMTEFLKRAAASTPLVLVLDDLHWADPSSLLLLQFVARDIADTRMLILGAYRNVDAGQQRASLDQTLAELTRGPQSHRIVLPGIEESDTNRFLSIMTGRVPSSALVSMVQQKSGGNPFFVSELVRLLLAEQWRLDEEHEPTHALGLPESVRDVINRRLGRLSDACNDILSAASVIGRQFSLPVLTQVSDRSVDELLDGLDEAVQARILEAVGVRAGYRFSHALIQDTLYAQLSTATRVRLHASVGAALEQVHVANPAPYLSEIAHHYWQSAPGGSVDQAIDAGMNAVRHAMTQLAYEDAAAQYQRVLQAIDLTQRPDTTQRCDILLLLGAAQRAAGRPAARTTFLDAAAHARALGLPDRLARAALGLAGNIMLVGFQDKEIVALLREAVATTAQQRDALHARCLAHLAVGLAAGDRLDQMDEHVATSQAAVAAARELGDPEVLAIALHSRHDCSLAYSQLDEAAAAAAEMESAAVDSGNRELMLTATVWRTFEPFSLGDIAAVDGLLERAARILDDLRQPYYTYVLTIISAHRAMTCGHFARGFELAEQARQMTRSVAIARRYTDWSWIALTDFYLRERGSLPQLLNELQRARSFFGEIGERRHYETAQAMMSVVLAEQGCLDDARSTMEPYLALLEHWPPNLMAANILYPVSHLAETAHLLDDRELAERVYRVLEPYARFNLTTGGNFMSRGSAAHFLGLLATTLEDWDDAERHFERAIAMNAQMGMPPYVARTQHAYAAMLLRRDMAGDTEKARELARQAGATARRLGMSRLAEQAQHLLDQEDAESPPGASEHRQTASAHGLTPRELDVLRLIAEGKADREIAADLYVSPRTVSTHVTSILQKFDVSSRSAAVAAAVRQRIIQ